MPRIDKRTDSRNTRSPVKTFRLEKEYRDILRDLARKHKMSESEIVRIALNRLSRSTL